MTVPLHLTHGRNTPMEFEQVVNKGIRGGDFLEEGKRLWNTNVKSVNPTHRSPYYGFRTFRHCRIPVGSR